MNFGAMLGLANDPDLLIATLNLHLAAGQLSEASIAKLKAAHAALPAGTSALDTVRSMTYLTLLAPEAAVQR